MKSYQWCGLVIGLWAATVAAEEVRVSDAWVRATAPGQDSAAVQMVITSDKAGTLVGVESSAARSTELHAMSMENNMMKMRAVKELRLPAQSAVALAANGHHIMLIGLKHPLKAGEEVPIALRIRLDQGNTLVVKTKAVVKPLDTVAPPEEHDHHHHH